jgi:hypothetical protein
MSKWWYALNQTKHGPITLADLVQLFRSSKVDLETLVWTKGMEAWQPIGSLPHLMSVFGKVPKAKAETDDGTSVGTDQPKVDTTRVDTPGRGVPEPEKKSGSLIASAFVWLGIFGVVGLAAYFYFMKPVKPHIAAPVVQAAPKDPPAGLLWTNPRTQVQLRLEEGWAYSSKVSAKGLVQHIFTDKNERAYIALTAKVGVQASLSAYVATFQKENVDRIEFKGEATMSEKNGVRYWQREGAIQKMTNYRVRVEIVQLGNVFWDVEVIQMAPFLDTDAKVDMLVSGLLTTLK